MEIPLCVLFLSFSPQSPVHQEVGVVAKHSLKHLSLKTGQVDNIF